jgi:hypothetical protein
MKTIFVIAGILLAGGIPGDSQLILNTGEAWNYQFSSLPFAGPINALTTNLGGGFGFAMSSQSGATLRVEIFENSTAETPLSSNTIASPLVFFQTNYFNPGAWADVQGAVRLTALAGPLTLEVVRLRAITPSPSLSSYNLFDATFVPVPEPGVLCLLAAAGGVCALKICRRQTRRR